MGIVSCILGVAIFAIGLIIVFSKDAPGGMAKTLVPAVGVVSYIFGTNLIVNAPAEPPLTAQMIYKDVFENCMVSRSTTNYEVATALKMTREEMCARGAAAVLEAAPKTKANDNEKVLLPVPAQKSNP